MILWLSSQKLSRPPKAGYERKSNKMQEFLPLLIVGGVIVVAGVFLYGRATEEE